MPALQERIIASVVSAALVAGCGTVSSRHVAVDASPTTDAAGLTYFLPMRMMKVTATRMTLAKLEEAATSKAAKAKKALEDKAKLDEELKAAKLRLETAEPAAAARLELKIAGLEAKVAEAETTAKTLKGEADKAQAAFEDAKALGSPCTYTANLELMPPQADPRFRFVARMTHSGLRDDHLELRLTPASLLTSSKVEAADRTGDILVEAVAALAAFSNPNVYSSPAPSGAYYLNLRDKPVAPEPPHCATLPTQFQYVFDPVRDGVGGLNEALIAAEFPFSVSMTNTFQASSAEGLWSNFPNTGHVRSARTDPASGIYYRSATPVLFTLNRVMKMGAADNPNPNPCAASLLAATTGATARQPTALEALATCLASAQFWQPIDSVVATIPQAGPISYIPMTATAFVKSTDDVQFADGSISGWTSDRPSEVLSFVKLPAQALTRVSELLTLRISYTASHKSLAQAQREEIQADMRWRQFERCVREARAKQAPVEACFPE